MEERGLVADGPLPPFGALLDQAISALPGVPACQPGGPMAGQHASQTEAVLAGLQTFPATPGSAADSAGDPASDQALGKPPRSQAAT